VYLRGSRESAQNRRVKEFKEFLLRGNLVELAVAVVIGVAFAALVDALVQDLVTPLIAALGGQQDFSALTFTINDSVFRYGHFLNQLLSFLLIAAVVYFLVVKPVNALMARRKTEEPVDEATRECPECLSSIPVAARRCAFCTTELRPA
jgi:large conductance mechanosensitive channel